MQLIRRVKQKRIRIGFLKHIGRATLFLHGYHNSVAWVLPTFGFITKILFFGGKRYGKSFFQALYSLLEGLFFGYFSEIRTEGVGFRFFTDEETRDVLGLSLGYSHPVAIRLPRLIKYRAYKYRLFLYGVIKQF